MNGEFSRLLSRAVEARERHQTAVGSNPTFVVLSENKLWMPYWNEQERSRVR